MDETVHSGKRHGVVGDDASPLAKWMIRRKHQTAPLVTGDDQLEALNQRITQFISSGFLNTIFADFRYRIAAELGSRFGSRGEFLDAKRKWLGDALTPPR
jgi:hypothetical protein